MGLPTCVPVETRRLSLSLELWTIQLGRLDSMSPGCSLLLTAPSLGLQVWALTPTVEM